MDNDGKNAEVTNRFLIDIRYQKHETWQGEIVWVDENRHRSFRSALEMLKLIEKAMDETTPKKSESLQNETE